jgi:two-component system KDP operon response regulator KdpE
MQDVEIRGLLRFELNQQGFEVLEAGSGHDGVEVARRCRPAAILLDLDVRDVKGLAVIRELRQWSHMPILALAGRINTAGPVAVLDQGANDYIPRPFALNELCARLRAAVRHAPEQSPEIFRSGSLTVDLPRRSVKVGSKAVRLSATDIRCSVSLCGTPER